MSLTRLLSPTTSILTASLLLNGCAKPRPPEAPDSGSADETYAPSVAPPGDGAPHDAEHEPAEDNDGRERVAPGEYKSDYVPPPAPKVWKQDGPLENEDDDDDDGAPKVKTATFDCTREGGDKQILVLKASAGVFRFEMKDPEYDEEAADPRWSNDACSFSGTIKKGDADGELRYVGANDCLDADMPLSLELTYAVKKTNGKLELTLVKHSLLPNAKQTVTTCIPRK